MAGPLEGGDPQQDTPTNMPSEYRDDNRGQSQHGAIPQADERRHTKKKGEQKHVRAPIT